MTEVGPGSELIYRRLSVQAPQRYRTWVRTGIAVALIGYTLAFATIQLEHPWEEQSHPRELYVIAACLVAAALERRGQLQPAALIISGAIWFEMHLSLLMGGARVAAGGVFPAAVAGIILLFGPRAGQGLALVSVLSVPAVVELGRWLGLGPGIQRGDLIYLVGIDVSMVATAVLIGLLMNTLGGVLSIAERDARRVRGLIDGAPDAILAVSSEGLIEDCNASAEALFGRTRTQLLGSRFGSLRLGQSRAADAPPIDVRDLGEKATELWVHAPRPCDGARDLWVPVEAVARSVTREDGARDFLVALRDLSQRKLEQERTASLQRQLQHSQKLEALGKLAGGVAHDFNNLLMAVGGFAESLSRHPDARVRDIAENLGQLRQRAAGLTGHLLAFARKGMTQPKAMDLAAAVADTPRLLRPLLGEGVKLQIEAPEPAFIYADPAQIEQVLLNLALNARDAMAGKGTLTIRCLHRAELGGVELFVSDTGHGMDEATRLSAFEPFFTTKPRTQGTGLGLALVHGIMEASGGTIRLDSELGRGTSFTLSWRALGAGAATAQPGPLSLQHQGEH